jgi:GT2 family glycosyltransferase
MGLNWHLVIVDNASTDNTCEILRCLDDPRITVVFNKQNLGFAAASNQGIALAQKATADHILLINNDTEFDEKLFSGLSNSIVASGADAVTPLIPFFDRPGLIWYGGGRFLDWRGGISFHDHYQQPISATSPCSFKTSYAPGCCLVFKASVFDRIGYLDEQYFVYWEDSDYCWRMRKAGMTVLCDPSLVLQHKVSVSTGGSESDFSIRYLYRNHMLFLRKYRSKSFIAYVLLVLFFKALGRLALRRTDRRRLELQLAALKEGLTMTIWTGRGIQPALSTRTADLAGQ